MYFSKHKSFVQCELCPRNCKIKTNEKGFCNVRMNKDGELKSLVYGRVAGGLAIDPIEKKPFFHFLPGQKVLSFGTVGCNLHCKHCQNWNTSQVKPGQIFEKSISPEEIVKAAIKNNTEIIAYTYNEPSIFYEFMLETAKLAKKNGLKNVIVSNGFINPEPLKKLCKYIDAANIDLKGFDNHFYGKVTSAWIEPIKETIKTLKKEKVWLEITNLIIPGYNDNLDLIKKMCEWIKKVDDTIPLHFTAFRPCFEMPNVPPTSAATLLNAYDVAKEVDLKFVYIGNLFIQDHENTTCLKCNSILIEREGFRVINNNTRNGKCNNCKTKLEGFFN